MVTDIVIKVECFVMIDSSSPELVNFMIRNLVCSILMAPLVIGEVPLYPENLDIRPGDTELDLGPYSVHLPDFLFDVDKETYLITIGNPLSSYVAEDSSVSGQKFKARAHLEGELRVECWEESKSDAETEYVGALIYHKVHRNDLFGMNELLIKYLAASEEVSNVDHDLAQKYCGALMHIKELLIEKLKAPKVVKRVLGKKSFGLERPAPKYREVPRGDRVLKTEKEEKAPPGLKDGRF